VGQRKKTFFVPPAFFYEIPKTCIILMVWYYSKRGSGWKNKNEEKK
jgi:hypothetical protein